MTDFICAFMAAAYAFVNMMIVVVAAMVGHDNTKKYSNQEAHPVEEENKMNSSGYKDAYKNASGAVYNPYKRQVVVTSAESGKDTSVADWCSQNMDLLIKISSSHADIFLIPNDKLDGIDIYSLSKKLFEQINNVCSVEQTNDGLQIKTN